MSKELVSADRLFELQQELLVLSATATAHFFRLGEIMKEIRDQELWRSGYDSFEAFYSDPDFGYKKSSVYHAIRLTEVFPERKDLMDIPLGKLIMVAPHINDTNREELVSQARALSKSDLEHQLTVMKLVTLNPKWNSFPKIYPCTTCGKVKGISFGDLCHCGWSPDHAKKIERFIDSLNGGGYTNDEDEEPVEIIEG